MLFRSIWSVKEEYIKDPVQAAEYMKILQDICGEIWFLSELPWTQELGAWEKESLLNKYKCIMMNDKGWIRRLIEYFYAPKNWKVQMIEGFLKQRYIIYTNLVHVETVLFFDSNEENRQAALAMNNKNIKVSSSLQDLVESKDTNDALDQKLEAIKRDGATIIQVRSTH